VLRPRASDLGTGKNPSGKGEKPSQQANPTKKPVPKGVPTCMICKGILPVISVDSEIVWGLEGYDEKGKKLKGKKTSSLECPRYAIVIDQFHFPANMLDRCMRHREIYNVSWPYRLVSHGGTAYPTPPPVDLPVTSSLAHSSKPRQESREVSMSRSTSSKATSKNRRDDEDQRPTKRKKVEADVEPSPVERSRSGRPHIPSRKLRESTEDREKSILPPQKPSQVVKISSKQKETQKETAPQPPKKSRAERADGRTKVREQLEKAHTTKPHPSTIAKTPAAGADGGSEDGMVLHSISSRKRPRIEEHVPVKRSSSVEAAEASEVIASMAPRPSLSGMRAFRKGGYSGSLGVAPNPMNLARRKWMPMVTDSDPSDDLIPDPDTPPRAESSSSSITEDSLQLITPHDSDGPNLEASGETEGVQATRRPRAFLSQSMKPSPVNFAMRRWSSMGSPKSDHSETDSQDELDEPIPRTSASTIVDITLHSAPENTRRPSARYTTPEPRSYVPSRIWETGGDVSLVSPCASDRF
jgi:histone-lysine N-methyltransferase SUV420H